MENQNKIRKFLAKKTGSAIMTYVLYCVRKAMKEGYKINYFGMDVNDEMCYGYTVLKNLGVRNSYTNKFVYPRFWWVSNKMANYFGIIEGNETVSHEYSALDDNAQLIKLIKKEKYVEHLKLMIKLMKEIEAK